MTEVHGNDRKWKSYEYAETYLANLVKSLQVNLISADFSQLEPLCAPTALSSSPPLDSSVSILMFFMFLSDI